MNKEGIEKYSNYDRELFLANSIRHNMRNGFLEKDYIDKMPYSLNFDLKMVSRFPKKSTTRFIRDNENK